jgi:hypothetical protein
MKTILLLLLLGFALSLCNITNKLKGVGSSGGASKSDPAATGSADVETPQPTAAQIAALAGGQNVTWDKQGMSWMLPPGWTENTNETKSFGWSAPGNGAHLIVSISPMDESFPTDVSIQAFYDGAKTRAKNGEVDELKWVEIDGLKGVQFRESNPEHADDSRRLQWLAYRKYAGQVQMINLMLASSGQEFPKHQNAMYGILYSTKITH